MDSFTESFKRYKRQKNSDKFSSVIDLNLVDLFKDKVQLFNHPYDSSNSKFPFGDLGLIPADKWTVYLFLNHEGCYLIKNPFTNEGRKLWLRRCLESYPLTPNVNNLGVPFNIESNPWLQLIQNQDDEITKSKLAKLHWVTLGYHHNWDTKVYDLEKVSEFPQDLSVLAKCVAERLGFRDFQAEAAIINYYSPRSTIGGHTDHSEFDHSAPLISVSFGLNGVFLLGGLTKDVKPSSMFLRSGDILVMSGPNRLAYHAVPLVLPSAAEKCPGEDVEENLSVEERKLQFYANNFRVNMNVRQVFTSEKVCQSLLSDAEDNR